MFKFSKKFKERVSGNLKKYQNITSSHRTRDVSEADTVTVIKDMLCDIFGYDKYTELTSEQQIRGTFCDLAVQIDGKVCNLIEVKAAGVSLNDNHLRQAINYGAHHGIEWVTLTNSIEWRLFKIKFSQPIDYEEIMHFSLDSMNHKNEDDLNKLFLLAREGMETDAVSVFHQQIQILNRYTIAQLLLSDSVINHVRKDFKKLFPNLKVENDLLLDLLQKEIIKRDVLEGDKVVEAQVRLRKAANKINRAVKKSEIPCREDTK